MCAVRKPMRIVIHIYFVQFVSAQRHGPARVRSLVGHLPCRRAVDRHHRHGQPRLGWGAPRGPGGAGARLTDLHSPPAPRALRPTGRRGRGRVLGGARLRQEVRRPGCILADGTEQALHIRAARHYQRCHRDRRRRCSAPGRAVDRRCRRHCAELIPALVRQAAAGNGDGEKLVLFADFLANSAPYCTGYLPKCHPAFPLSFGAALSLNCPVLHDDAVWHHLCSAWAVTDPSPFVAPVTTPTLVLTGAYDGMETPKAVHDAIAAAVPDAHFIDLPLYGHNVLGKDCAREIRSAWLAGDLG